MYTNTTLLQLPDTQLSDLSCSLRKHRTQEKASDKFNQRQVFAVRHKEGQYPSEALLSQLSLTRP